ncbi:MAG: cupin domain-containing protein, partial [Sphingobacteriaceae bacterium]
MTRAAFEPINSSTNYSFAVRRFHQKEFTSPYHFHPEYELTLILEGEGNRYVGNDMSVYSAGDLVLLGENLPHCWKSSTLANNTLNASSIVVQF